MTALYGLKSYGLLAHPLVEALLRREPDVYRRCAAFAAGEAEPVVTVAGLPDDQAMLRLCNIKNEPVALTIVALHLSLTRHGAGGKPTIRIDTSDADLAELLRWKRAEDVRLDRNLLEAGIIRARDARAFRLGEVPR